MVTPIADLPAWAQVAIAMAVPLNTLIVTAGALLLRHTAKQSRRDRGRMRLQQRRITQLEEDVGARRNGTID